MIRLLGWQKLITATGVACLALTTHLIAGPFGGGGRDSRAGSDSRFGSGNNRGVMDSQTPDNSSNSSFDRQRNRDNDDRDFGRTRGTEEEANGTDASESGRSSATGAGGDGTEQRSTGSGFIKRGPGQEVVETRNEKGKEGERESSEHRSEKSEVSKKFESSLLLADVARAPSATAGSLNKSGPTNNPGVDHMSQQGLQNSEAGRTIAQNAIDQQGAQNHIPPGHHYGWKRGEDNPHNPPRERERLNEQEKERLKGFLREHLTEQQRERLKGILEDGLTPTEREELRDFFKEKLTPKQWGLLKEFLNHKLGESD